MGLVGYSSRPKHGQLTCPASAKHKAPSSPPISVRPDDGPCRGFPIPKNCCPAGATGSARGNAGVGRLSEFRLTEFRGGSVDYEGRVVHLAVVEAS